MGRRKRDNEAEAAEPGQQRIVEAGMAEARMVKAGPRRRGVGDKAAKAGRRRRSGRVGTAEAGQQARIDEGRAVEAE